MGQQSKSKGSWDPSIHKRHVVFEKNRSIQVPSNTMNTTPGHRCLHYLLVCLVSNFLFISQQGQSSALTITLQSHQFTLLLKNRKESKQNKVLSFLQRGTAARTENLFYNSLTLPQSSKWFQQDSHLQCLHWMTWAFTSWCHYHATKTHLWLKTVQSSDFSQKLLYLKRREKIK